MSTKIIITLKKNRSIIPYDLLFLIVLPLAGLFCWALFYGLTIESVQFFGNVFMPFSSITIIMISIGGLAVKNKLVNAYTIALISLSVIYNYHYVFNVNSIPKQDVMSVRNFINKYPYSYFVNIRKEEEFNTFFSKNTIVFQPLIFLDYLISPYINISLNTPVIPIDSSSAFGKLEKRMVDTAPFSLYVKSRKNATLDENIYLFMKEKKIHFISVSPGVTLPDQLKPLIKDSVCILSNGWKIYYAPIQ